MRVGVFVDRHDPSRGGMERALCALIERLLASGDEVIVYALAAADGAPGVVRIVDVPRLPRGELERELAARSVVGASIDACDVTLAVRHASNVDALWPHGGAHRATLAAGERSKGGVAASVSRVLHRVSPRHRAFLDLERAALEGGARRVWCVSELVRRELCAAYPACDMRIEVHPNGVDRERFAPGLRATHRDAVRTAWGVADGAPVLVFPGGNLRLKGWSVLLAALRDLVDAAWTCAAIGVDGEDACRDVRAAGLAGRVIVLPRQDMTHALGAADLLVQPTFRDPCSLTTLEALAAGVPVVTTNANGAADAIGPASGAVVDAGDVAALTAALRAWLPLVASDAGRSAASAAAREATAGRDAHAWLDGLATSLRELAG